MAPGKKNLIGGNKNMIMNGINEVSEATGIHPSSLRRWESVGLIAADRIAFGKTWMRVYSDEDVELLNRNYAAALSF